MDPFSPQVVVSLLPLEDFDAPVYDQIHQKQIVAGEMTPNIVENPVVQEQVIVLEIPTAAQPHIFLKNSTGSLCSGYRSRVPSPIL